MVVLSREGISHLVSANQLYEPAGYKSHPVAISVDLLKMERFNFTGMLKHFPPRFLAELRAVICVVLYCHI